MLERESALKGIISKGVRYVAGREKINPEVLAEKVAEGKVVILKHRNTYLGIGEGLKIKVNANIGTSPDIVDVHSEIEKLKAACKYGADTVMDLSTGGDINKIRQTIVERSPVPVGTVPVYQAAIESIEEKGALVKMEPDKLFDVIEKHAEDGISFVTLHCGITLNTLERLRKSPRKTMVVSRGGAFLISWMIANEKENPLYEHFDRVLDIARKYDLVLSLGDGMRPGSIVDATDNSQIDELLTLGELTEIAWKNGVQVIIEGPGHIPLNEIPANVVLQKKICKGAPFYVLGPVVTDIAPGYDHITSTIGAAVAGWYGADFICYVTPSEHLGLPEIEEVVEGTIAAKIAAHSADIARGLKNSIEWDYKMDIARTQRNWQEEKKLSIDPFKFDKIHKRYKSTEKDVCTMCGKYCAIKTVEKYLGVKIITS
ncbi:MAG TPA: phosphomethylpyrimidine synthase ThiC [bacterium]|nr:phosphomethylpyrimidine synthase ThiC [bacterium]HPP29545.1 phosphomethylpyrimidine synthase ThiC [bacterium]